MTPRQCGHMWTHRGVDTLALDTREGIQLSMSGTTTQEMDTLLILQNLRLYWEASVNNMKRVGQTSYSDSEKCWSNMAFKCILRQRGKTNYWTVLF